ncbi:hypothetical protein [Thaumasiovibrio subtropicus]|uniref:hypothetical protein n=1 Tax=Thaumasiovibrio subtropicus TaxID=1891207 RepID=UPI000B35A646|nr:hypothetical protein [Thaumasiovibrio subtropicus]
MKIPLSLKGRANKKELTQADYVEQIQAWMREERPLEMISEEDLVQVLGGDVIVARAALESCRNDELAKRRAQEGEAERQQEATLAKPDAITGIMKSALQQIKGVLDSEVQEQIALREAEFARVRGELEEVIRNHLGVIADLKENVERIDSQRIEATKRADSLSFQLVEERERIAEMEEQCNHFVESLADRQKKLDSLQSHLESQDMRHRADRKEHSEKHNQQITALQNEYQKLGSIQVTKLEARLEEKEAVIEGLQSQLSALEATLNSSNQALARASVRAETAERELEVAQLKIIADSENKYKQTDIV